MNKLEEDKEDTLMLSTIKLAEDKYSININDKIIKKIIKIVEKFISDKGLICYGGTAINNLLPKKDKFYQETEFPDYDFYSMTPMKDAVELANIYYEHGYKNVQAKSGVHYGTYKVYVNFLPVADITELDPLFFLLFYHLC